MSNLSSLSPYIRVGHHYRFPWEGNSSESERIGYCYAFHFIDGGKGTISCQGRTFPVKRGDLVYFPPMTTHSFFTDPDQLLSSFNIYCELWADSPVSTDLHLIRNPSDFNSEWVTPIIPCDELDRLPVVMPLQHHVEFMDLFSYAVIHYRKGEKYSREIANSLLKAFLLEILQTNHSNFRMDYRMKPILDRIDREPALYSNYEAWLEECGLQKTHFNELFKQSTGLSPKAYWKKAIMRQAEAALCESNQSISTIAEDLGYSSIHHFTRQFTKFHGVSPTEYRRRRQ